MELIALQTEFCCESNNVDRALVQMCKMLTAEFLRTHRSEIYEGTGTIYEDTIVSFGPGENFEQIIALILKEKEYSVQVCVGTSITLRALNISCTIESITVGNEVFKSLDYNDSEPLAKINLLFRLDHYDILYRRLPNLQHSSLSSSSTTSAVAAAAVTEQEQEQSKDSSYIPSENSCSVTNKNPVASLENGVYGLKGD